MEHPSYMVSFAKGMEKAAQIISDQQPDYVIAPMMGSVPLIDSMYVVDPNFDPNRVHYMPASSHIPDITNIMRDWLDNFLAMNAGAEERVKLMSLDEVVSGSSATRVNRAIQNAVHKRTKNLVGNVLHRFWTNDPREFSSAADYLDNLTDHEHNDDLSRMVMRQQRGMYERDMGLLSEDTDVLKNLVAGYFKDHITHLGIGIEDAKSGTYKSRNRHREYAQMVEQGKVIPIPVETIPTMDDRDMCPVRYQQLPRAKGGDYLRYSPILDPVPSVTSKYMQFLTKLREISGGRDDIGPVSLERAFYSGDYLSRKYGGNFQKPSTS